MRNKLAADALLHAMFVCLALLFGFQGCGGGSPTVSNVETAADVACQVFLLVDPSAPELVKEGCLTIEELDKMKERKGHLAARPAVKVACPPSAASR